ncbi:MAG TPA: NAD(P)(+) transhydrogenase (Re/Si-specific) subunit beta [Gaiellales bacterium]|nr:NAD(P)(+) transhydrogenase (Re/Si-specific) subunit beta [Gaiellales bacterium]
MSRTDAIGAAYLVCAILFIIGLRRLSSPATARSGNQLAAIGMAFAIVATLFDERVLSYQWIALGAVMAASAGRSAPAR